MIVLSLFQLLLASLVALAVMLWPQRRQAGAPHHGRVGWVRTLFVSEKIQNRVLLVPRNGARGGTIASLLRNTKHL